MMKWKKRIASTVALVMVFAASFALADSVQIGAIAPLTGPVANYGLMVKDGVDLYVEEINAAGGVLGQTIEISWLDDKHDPVEAINAYNQLTGNGVKAVIGPVTTTPTLAASARAAEDNMPMISPSATAYDVTSAGPNVFRTCFLDPFQAELMAQFAAEKLEAKKVAVLYDNTNDYSIGLNESFQKKAEELGLEVVAVEAAVENDADYTPQLIKIANAEPDALFICYYYETAALVIRQAVDIGLDVSVMGADGWTGIEAQLQDNLALLDKAYYCDSFSEEDDSEITKAFVAAFEAKYGKAAAGFNALGYDTAKILFEAIEKAGTFDDKDAIIAAIKATDGDFATGHIVYDDHNDPIKSAFVKGFEEGVAKLIARIDP